MGTPTKEAIIGTFINGRNAQDDFLQLANNHGGTVFGWIDAAGHLQGSLLQGTGTPGGNDTDIQFNDAGTLGGSSAFTFNKATSQFTLLQSGSLTPVGLASFQGAGLGTSYEGFPTLAELITPNESSWPLVFANASAPGNTGATRQDFMAISQQNVGGGSLSWFHAGTEYFFIDATGTSEVDIGASGGTNLAIGVFGLDGISVTETEYKHDGPINFLIQDGGTGNVDIAFNKTSTVWRNWTAATNILNQNSPALVLTGQAWVGVSPSNQTVTFSIQEKDGVCSFTQPAGPAAVFPYVFDGPMSVPTISGNSAQFKFETGNASVSFPLSSVANAVGNKTTYTGVITPGGQFVLGQNVTISGFTTGANNGTFVVFSCSTTTLVVYNSSGVSESHVATVTAQGSYYSQAEFDSVFGRGFSFSIAGTSYVVNAAGFEALPYQPLIAFNVKGDSVDSGYIRIINDGSTGNHGLEFGGIIDSTGAAPVTLQLGHFGGTSAVVANSLFSAPTLIESTTHTPSSASDTGTTGQIAWDTGFIYICTATNTWKRVGIATW